MTRDMQLATVALVGEVLQSATVTAETAPEWLARPGRIECGARWELVCSIYEKLTGATLPEAMSRRERRRVDAVIEASGAAPRLLEFDESQHFNVHRAATLRAYPPDLDTAFPREEWLRRSEASTRKLSTTGGWERAKPPLFPEAGGRHLQRAFRDALADILPGVHRWATDTADRRFRSRGLDLRR